MRVFKFIVAAVGLLILAACLGGCTSPDPTKALTDGAGPGLGDGKSEAAKIADKLLGEAIGPDNRGVRLCMIGSGVIEVMTDRVTHADTGYAAEALGNVVAVRGVIEGLDTGAGNLWFETDVKIVLLQLGDLLVESAKDRVPRLLGNIAGAINPLGLAGRVGVVARQGALTEGIVLDVKHAIAAINGRQLTAADARTGCEARIERNEMRLRAVLGQMPRGPVAGAGP